MPSDSDFSLDFINELLREQFGDIFEPAQEVEEGESSETDSAAAPLGPPSTAIEGSVSSKHNPDLSLEKRRLIVENLLAAEQGQILPRGSQSRIAEQVGCHRSTVSRHYRRARGYRARGEAIDVRSKRAGKCGVKPTVYTDGFLSKVPLNLRTNYRTYAGQLNIAPTTVWKLMKKGRLRTHSATHKPALTEDHKIRRMQWILDHIIPATPKKMRENTKKMNEWLGGCNKWWEDDIFWRESLK